MPDTRSGDAQTPALSPGATGQGPGLPQEETNSCWPWVLGRLRGSHRHWHLSVVLTGFPLLLIPPGMTSQLPRFFANKITALP